jgi:hypothetical protein
MDRAAILPYDLTVSGGTQRTTMYMVRALLRHGFRVDIITVSLQERVLSELRDVVGGSLDGVRIIKLFKAPPKNFDVYRLYPQAS